MASHLFSSKEKELIRQAIADAEKATSGEIRVYIEETSKDDPLDRAAYLFKKLHMHETGLRNGALIYLAMDDHKFAIIGDAGIHAVTGNDFWDHIKEEMSTYFKQGQFIEGLKRAIHMVGEALQTHFPYKEGTDKNELSDDIAFPEGKQ